MVVGTTIAIVSEFNAEKIPFSPAYRSLAFARCKLEYGTIPVDPSDDAGDEGGIQAARA